MTDEQRMDRLYEGILEKLDIPPSYYDKAKARYESIAEWLHRDGSEVAHLNPDVYPQGSFRLGTVIKPISNKDDYDLDLVCRVDLSKAEICQYDLKQMIGREIMAYAVANNISKPVDEGKRCWTLEYSDGVRFHMDILPAIPETEEFIGGLLLKGVPGVQAAEAISITDRANPNYKAESAEWPSSNPRGFAMWFEEQMGSMAIQAKELLVEQRLYASVEEVPTNAVKTPLQRAIQILKRHRDELFKDDPDTKPISIIIATLAARAYNGESDLGETISGILSRMETFVADAHPRIPNPTNPGSDGEDFADRWTQELERNFRDWLAQARLAYAYFTKALTSADLSEALRAKFNVAVGVEVLEAVAASDSEYEPPLINVSESPKPWGSNA